MDEAQAIDVDVEIDDEVYPFTVLTLYAPISYMAATLKFKVSCLHVRLAL